MGDIEVSNEFERRLLSDVIMSGDIGVRFDDVGALDATKAALKEIVMLPLQRPELFRRCNLAKPVKGVLLFGPPGYCFSMQILLFPIDIIAPHSTGKTLIAKAVATESGANFLSFLSLSLSDNSCCCELIFPCFQTSTCLPSPVNGLVRQKSAPLLLLRWL